jgi:hypothetical protein
MARLSHVPVVLLTVREVLEPALTVQKHFISLFSLQVAAPLASTPKVQRSRAELLVREAGELVQTELSLTALQLRLLTEAWLVLISRGQRKLAEPHAWEVGALVTTEHKLTVLPQLLRTAA